MKAWLMRTLTLSEQGARNLEKASLACTLYNISFMLPIAVIYELLRQLLAAFDLGDYAPKPPLLPYIAVILAILIICYLFTIWQYDCCFTNAYLESRSSRIRIAEKLRKLPLSFFGQRDLADLTTTIMSDVTGLEQGFSHFIAETIGAVAALVLCCIGLFFMDPVMTLALVWVIPVALLIVVWGRRFLDQQNEIGMKNKVTRADSIQAFLDDIADMKANGQTGRHLGRLDAMLHAQVGDTIRQELTAAVIVNAADFLVKLALATTVIAGVSRLASGRVGVLVFLVFMIAATRILTPVEGCLVNIAAIFNMMTQVSRMKEIYAEPEQTGTDTASYQNYDVTYRDVVFSYNEGERVINDVSFTAKQGEVTALIGPSGGGKSTLAKLAARFWDIQSGRIALGGNDISKIDPETLLTSYSIVFQDVLLFDTSVMENIRIGRKDATDDQVYAAARAARCDAFVRRLPNGYQTEIGENGSRLSGGERQRISIARALLKNAPVVLLDEATASLDVENESEVQEALRELLKGRTVLVIAHRMRTVANVDKIVVLSEGKIAEEGTPKELWEKGGVYRNMAELQEAAAAWAIK